MGLWMHCGLSRYLPFEFCFDFRERELFAASSLFQTDHGSEADSEPIRHLRLRHLVGQPVGLNLLSDGLLLRHATHITGAFTSCQEEFYRVVSACGNPQIRQPNQIPHGAVVEADSGQRWNLARPRMSTAEACIF